MHIYIYIRIPPKANTSTSRNQMVFEMQRISEFLLQDPFAATQLCASQSVNTHTHSMDITTPSVHTHTDLYTHTLSDVTTHTHTHTPAIYTHTSNDTHSNIYTHTLSDTTTHTHIPINTYRDALQTYDSSQQVTHI